MSIFELCETAGLKLSPSRSSKSFTLYFDFAYCSSTFSFCALHSAVCLSSRNRTSVSSSAILSFSISALSFFDDLEPDDDALECLLDLFDHILPDTLDLCCSILFALNISDQTMDLLLDLQHACINLIKPVLIFVLLLNW